MNNARVLVVDDDPSMQKVLPITLQKEGFQPVIARDGKEALQILKDDAIDFDCIILDVRMPGMSGLEVLSVLKQEYPLIPVIMLTALNELETGIKTMRSGAFDYMVKPVRKLELLETAKKAIRYRTILQENERLAKENRDYQRGLERKVEERTRELYNAYKKLQETNIETVKVLAETIEAKDPYTRGHCTRVRKLSLRIAESISLGSQDKETLEYGALLHDIGKIGIGETLLFKNGSLTEEERDVFRLHPVIGENILKDVDFFCPIIPVIRNHHEWYNGNGYPDQLAGDSIPILARIVGIADAFDAMTSNRPYRKAMSVDTALQELREGKQGQFDPDLVDAFIDNEIFLELKV